MDHPCSCQALGPRACVRGMISDGVWAGRHWTGQDRTGQDILLFIITRLGIVVAWYHGHLDIIVLACNTVSMEPALRPCGACYQACSENTPHWIH